jgi:hypothetical protein
MRRGCPTQTDFSYRSGDGPILAVDCPKLIRRLKIDDEARPKSAKKRQKAPFC